MNALYNGAVGYERFKNFWGAILCLFFGVIFIICAICSFLYPAQPKASTTPNGQPNNTPSEPAPSPYTWAIFSGFGVVLVILSGIQYFLATDNSETTKNILAAQGAYDAYSFIFNNRRNGGNFAIGE
jgi:uncharacterized membrane protein